MATAGRGQAVLETSVLVNFLKIDRVDLLARQPDYEFLITEHVGAEITQHYPNQLARLETAIQNDVELGILALDLANQRGERRLLHRVVSEQLIAVQGIEKDPLEAARLQRSQPLIENERTPRAVGKVCDAGTPGRVRSAENVCWQGGEQGIIRRHLSDADVGMHRYTPR